MHEDDINQQTDESQSPVHGIIHKFDAMRDELLADYKSNRMQLDEYINKFNQFVDLKGVDSKECVVVGLTSLLSVKNKATADAMHALDSMAKMVSAAKSMVDQHGNDEEINLDEMLKAELNADEP